MTDKMFQDIAWALYIYTDYTGSKRYYWTVGKDLTPIKVYKGTEVAPTIFKYNSKDSCKFVIDMLKDHVGIKCLKIFFGV